MNQEFSRREFVRTSAAVALAGVAMWTRRAGREARYAVCTEKGPEILACESLLGEAPLA